LRLNPLLINFNRNFNSKTGLANLAKLRSVFDADFRQQTINPDIARKVIRSTLSNLGTVNWLSIAGQTSMPVRIAVEKKIPLIIWGAHQGLEQVGMYSHLDNVEMTRRYRLEHDLMGVDENEILKFDSDFNKIDLTLLAYPDDYKINSLGIRGIYLGNFIRWDTVSQHQFVAKTYGYQGVKNARSYYNFDNPDCPVYMEFQDLMKFTRLGYGKVTDQLVRDIRFNRISRSSALRLESRFLRKKISRSNEFSQWLGASSKSLDLVKLRHEKFLVDKILNLDQNKTGIKPLSFFEKLTEIGKSSGDQDFTNFGKGL
jgi:hypothetical protein